jgi:hypothetical protein
MPSPFHFTSRDNPEPASSISPFTSSSTKLVRKTPNYLPSRSQVWWKTLSPIAEQKNSEDSAAVGEEAEEGLLYQAQDSLDERREERSRKIRVVVEWVTLFGLACFVIGALVLCAKSLGGLAVVGKAELPMS